MSTGLKVAVIGIPGAWSTEVLADAIAARTGQRFVVPTDAVTLDLERGRVLAGDLDLTAFDGVAVKKIAATYSPHAIDRLEVLCHLEALGVRVFSGAERMLRLIDRLSGTLLLARHGIPLPRTVVTEQIDEARAAVARFGQAVLKPLFTSKARGMRLVADGPGAEDALRAFRDAGNPSLYIQERLDLDRGRDLGLTFIGGRYVGCYARVKRQGAWSTTTVEGGHYERAEPDDASYAVAERAERACGLDFTCVDVVETADGPRVFEVSAFGGFRGLEVALGIDAAALYADHIVRSLAERHG